MSGAIPWAVITVPFRHSLPVRILNGLRLAAPESIRFPALAPVHTYSGSLSFAEDLLVSFSAFPYSVNLDSSHGARRLSSAASLMPGHANVAAFSAG